MLGTDLKHSQWSERERPGEQRKGVIRAAAGWWEYLAVCVEVGKPVIDICDEKREGNRLERSRSAVDKS